MLDSARRWLTEKLAPAVPPAPGRISAEIGSTGLRHHLGVIDETALRELRSKTRRWETYREMRLYDDTVASIMHAIEMMMRRVQWVVEAVDETPESTEAADFLQSAKDDMSHTWTAFISEVLWMLTFGFQTFEIVYKLRSGPEETDGSRRSNHTDRKIGWRKFAPRSAETIERWLFDDEGGLNGVEQRDANSNQLVQIPIENMLLFNTSHHKNNPEGRSVLEGAYIAWYAKKHIREIEAIGIERDLVGYPVLRVPGELFDSNAPGKATELAEWKRIIKDIRRDDQEGIVLPSDIQEDSNEPSYKFELVKAPGAKQFDTTVVIRRENGAIAGVVLADWILLGHESVGSRALSTDKTSIFEASLDGWMESIADVINIHAVPRLFAVNAWHPAAGLPRIRPASVAREDIERLTAALKNLAQSGAAIFPDDNLENHLRARMRLPERVEEQPGV